MYRFIHIPKNGGSAVADWLRQNNIEFLLGKSGKGVGKHKKSETWKNESSVKFCVVRHPYTRTLSYYNYIHSYEEWGSFDNYVRNKLNPQKFKIPSGWELQSSWILDEQGQSVVEKIFRYENLQQEIQEFFNCYKPLPVVNQSKSIVSLESLTPELKQIIHEHFKQDFEMFNYDP